jgi:hypothetical protein
MASSTPRTQEGMSHQCMQRISLDVTTGMEGCSKPAAYITGKRFSVTFFPYLSANTAESAFKL